jgi:predicted DCC family thiol-disulfide oxidoreductase YuxK
MHDLRDRFLIVLYDGACGFCEVVLAVLLRWDRQNQLDPVPIQSERGERLLADMPRQDRLASWHLIDRAGSVRSGGAAIPAVFASLPWGSPIAYVAGRFPRKTARAYEWVATHRALPGRLLTGRPRAWAARVVAERERRFSRGRGE